MKVIILVFGLAAVAYSAPQPRKLFHEHFKDFLDIIMEEAGDDLDSLQDEYLQYEEFLVSIDYLMTKDFRELVYEMESLPEFQAVVDFLEKDNIDILFFIDMLNEILENINVRRARKLATGRDMTSYINDVISLFPKAKLAALFDQTMAEDESFRVAIDNLQSDEWKQTFGALWESETFKAEVYTLAQFGIDVGLLIQEIMAVFGQN